MKADQTMSTSTTAASMSNGIRETARKNNLGSMWIKEGNFKQAIQYLTEAMEICERHAAAIALLPQTNQHGRGDDDDSGRGGGHSHDHTKTNGGESMSPSAPPLSSAQATTSSAYYDGSRVTTCDSSNRRNASAQQQQYYDMVTHAPSSIGMAHDQHRYRFDPSPSSSRYGDSDGERLLLQHHHHNHHYRWWSGGTAAHQQQQHHVPAPRPLPLLYAHPVSIPIEQTHLQHTTFMVQAAAAHSASSSSSSVVLSSASLVLSLQQRYFAFLQAIIFNLALAYHLYAKQEQYRGGGDHSSSKEERTSCLLANAESYYQIILMSTTTASSSESNLMYLATETNLANLYLMKSNHTNDCSNIKEETAAYECFQRIFMLAKQRQQQQQDGHDRSDHHAVTDDDIDSDDDDISMNDDDNDGDFCYESDDEEEDDEDDDSYSFPRSYHQQHMVPYAVFFYQNAVCWMESVIAMAAAA